MEYRILGRTGTKVSTIGIGGEGFENKNDEAGLFEVELLDEELFVCVPLPEISPLVVPL